ncbi:MAG: histidine--tRNA ligase, partial [Bacillota bacterium]
VVKEHPTLNSYLCKRCGQHFEQVKSMLSAYRVDFLLDSQLVRGLDYYTSTAFELLIPDLGAQSAVGGGGRYDGLIEECGGPPTPGIGFAMGLERLLLAVQKQDTRVWNIPPVIEVFVAVADKEYDRDACLLLDKLRQAGIKADKDYMDRSLKAQMKYAGKNGVRLVAVVGEEEIKHDCYILRDMMRKEQQEVPANQIIDRIKSILVTS